MFGRCVSSRLLSTSLRAISRPSRLTGARWQTNAAPHDGPPVTQTNRSSVPRFRDRSFTKCWFTDAEASMKRFWNTVGIDQRGDSLTVTLDDRALKTPSGNTLLLPPTKSLLAALIAAEWDNQEKLLKSHALPMVSFAANMRASQR